MDRLKKNLREEHVLIHEFLSTFYSQVGHLPSRALLTLCGCVRACVCVGACVHVACVCVCACVCACV